MFYEGHLPAFSVIAFLRRGLGRPPVDARLEQLFERGIDPETEAAAVPRSGASTVWPSRDEVRAFARACDEAVLAALASTTTCRVEGLYTALEHEAMHQETLLYMWHRLPYDQKRASGSDPNRRRHGAARVSGGSSAIVESVEPATPASGPSPIPAGVATLGADATSVAVRVGQRVRRASRDGAGVRRRRAAGHQRATSSSSSTPAATARRDCGTTKAGRGFRQERVSIQPSGCPRSTIGDRPWHRAWHGAACSRQLPLPPTWPVYVSQAEASAYARWKGRRLMTEAGVPSCRLRDAAGDERAPWGDDRRTRRADSSISPAFDPIAVGSFPAGASAWGVHDLVGNGWEWTSTVFAPVRRVSRRWRRIPSTPPTSSTAGTS